MSSALLQVVEGPDTTLENREPRSPLRNRIKTTPRKRCQNGTRRNKKTGECEPVYIDVPIAAPVPVPVVVKPSKCPNGTRRNKKTGKCEPTAKSVMTSSYPVLQEQSQQPQPQPQLQEKQDIVKIPRCPNGTRRNKKTGECDPVDKPEQPQAPVIPNVPNEQIESETSEDTVTRDSSVVAAPEASPAPSLAPEPEPEQVTEQASEPVQESEQAPEPEEEKASPEPQASSEEPEIKDHVELYPEHENADFNQIIANKKEFHEVRYDKMDEYTVEEYANRMCSEGDVFELAPHQLFARNFLSAMTPYKSLLLYHGLGTGKTCSAISVAEEMRDYMKEMGMHKRIYVVASPAIKINFKLQLFNPSKLSLNRSTGTWSMNTCVGNQLLKEIRAPTVSKDISIEQEERMKDAIISKVESLIQKTYSFIGYEKLKLIIEETLFGRVKSTTASLANITEQQIRRIRNRFDDTLIVIDEVHNLRTTGENESDAAKMTGKLLTLVARHTQNMRMLLLTATPMYNSPKEILWLINLMRINDNRPEIAYNQVFIGSGTDETIKTVTDEDASRSAYSSGKEVLKSAAYGYISYVKGENPFTFPYRIYPKDHSPSHSFFSAPEKAVPFPSVNFNGASEVGAEFAAQTRFLDVYMSPIGEEQKKVYDLCINKLRESGRDASKSNTVTGDGKEKQKEEEDEEDENAKDTDSPSSQSKSKFKSKANVSPDNENENENDESDSRSESDSESGVDADADAEKAPKDEVAAKFGFKARSALQALTMSFPGPELDNPEATASPDFDPKTMVGRTGFKRIMSETVQQQGPLMTVRYSYRPDAERVFAPDNIGKWSSKIASVCKHADECNGIVLVYTEYIEGGAVPVALALEERGYSRFESAGVINKLLLNPTPSTAAAAAAATTTATTMATTKRKCYTLITGNKMLSPAIRSAVVAATSKANASGDVIKVIIITKAGSEGIDLKNIRQVHVIDPWYNLSLIEQVIGRAVRNCSHVDLPFERRNVCIFIHGTRLTDDAGEVEAIDVGLLHHAESKAKRIGNVNSILKKNAVDCNLNKEYNVPRFKDGNSVVRQVLSTFEEGDGVTPVVLSQHDIRMQPRTDACDYQDECDTGCEPDIAPEALSDMGTDTDTYNMKFLTLNSERVIHRVRALFKERFFYTEAELVRHVNQVRTYSDEQIMVALNTLVNDPYETITDYYGRLGRLVHIGNYYLFQPDGVTNPKIGLRERAMPVEEGVDAIEVEQPHELQQGQQLGQQVPQAQVQLQAQVHADQHMGKLYRMYTILFNGMKGRRMAAAIGDASSGGGGDDDFIVFAPAIMNQLAEKSRTSGGASGVDEDTLILAAMSHYMDMLSKDAILEIVNSIIVLKMGQPYRRRGEPGNEDVDRFERLVHAYLSRQMVSCDNGNAALVAPSEEIVKWTDTATVPSKQLKNKSDDAIIKYIEEEFFRHVNFISSSVQSVATDKWKNSAALTGRDKTLFSTCILKWFLRFNRKLVQHTGKTTMVHNIPYTLGCTRWSSAKSAHEFILIDMAHQKSVIHGQVPNKKQEVVELLSRILASKNCALDEFIDVGAGVGMGQQDAPAVAAKKGKGSVKATKERLVVFTELMLRAMDIIPPDGEMKWYLRPCELQLVTKVGSIYNINKVALLRNPDMD